MKVKPTSRRSTLIVTTDGAGIASHAGSAALTDLADRLGWTTALSAGMAPTRRRRSAHDPGRVVRDLIVSTADGGDCLADLSVLRGQPELFGEVASSPTAWRVVESITPERPGVLREARRRAREQAWTNGAAPEQITLDFDATLVTAHSEKEGAAGNFKGGFGFHPLVCYLDESSEALAAILRPGNAGANTAADHIAVLYQALEQLPDPAWGMEILARADSGGATHDFVNVLRELQMRFSCGFDLTEPVRDAILATPEDAWVPAITQAGEEREGAAVCELTNLDLSAWPEGTRAICRREAPIPEPSSPSLTARAFASKSSSPTRTAPTWPSSRRVTAVTLGSRTASAAARTPACATSPSVSSPPTRSGWSSSSPPRTCSPSSSASASTAMHAIGNPRPSATGSSTSLAAWHAAGAASSSACSVPGAGRHCSPPPSGGSAPFQPAEPPFRQLSQGILRERTLCRCPTPRQPPAHVVLSHRQPTSRAGLPSASSTRTTPTARQHPLGSPTERSRLASVWPSETSARGTPYQRLIRDLVEAGLAAGSTPLARLEVSADLRERIATERSVTIEVRRAS